MSLEEPSSRDPVVGLAPPTPDAARDLFGDRVEVAEHYVAILADTGISHGLVGPREAPRLWERHVLNCAVVHPLFAPDTEVADIGSGAGLPGLVLAIIRPDLHLHLVEPLQRRTVWLRRAVEELELDNVTVQDGRAENLWGGRRFPAVTARAVARLRELGRWTLPLLDAGGSLHALKGSRGPQELVDDREELTRLGAASCSVNHFGSGIVNPETVVVSVTVASTVPGRRAPKRPAHDHHRRD